jgi:hypothetical protein
MSYNKFYGQLVEGAEKIFNEGYKNRTDTGKEPAKWILKTLRKYAALDTLAEFLERVPVPKASNRHYQAGYQDALEDLARFIQREMDKDNG